MITYKHSMVLMILMILFCHTIMMKMVIESYGIIVPTLWLIWNNYPIWIDIRDNKIKIKYGWNECEHMNL
jgi:hypothetical protein